jgi:hypothetical protein
VAKANPIQPFPTELDRDAFGHWLSGFCDGESCFKLRQITERSRSACAQFNITIRADDYECLALIRSYLGCGTMHFFSNERRAIKNAKPVWIYGVQDIPSLVSVVIPHFTAFPLRAKKRNDFAIWSQAVLFIRDVQQRPTQHRRLVNRYNGTDRKWMSHDVQHFNDLCNALKQQRVYGHSTTTPAIQEPPPEPPQPALFDCGED